MSEAFNPADIGLTDEEFAQFTGAPAVTPPEGAAAEPTPPADPATKEDEERLVDRVAKRFGIEPKLLLPSLRATAFRLPNKKQGSEWVAQQITNAQALALLVLVDQYKLNPWTREIFAFPGKFGEVIPVVSVDGWTRIINTHPAMAGITFSESEAMVYPEDPASPAAHKPCPEWVEVTIYRRDRAIPFALRERFHECYRPATYNSDKGEYGSGPWQTHTSRFLRHKALIQAARVCFGFAGIYDLDEATRIIEGQILASRVEHTPRLPHAKGRTLDAFAPARFTEERQPVVTGDAPDERNYTDPEF